MPPIETYGRFQKAVYWEFNGFRDDFGEPRVDNPVEIDVRWEAGKRESVDEKGNPVAVEGTVIVDRDIPIGSIIWLGSLSELPAEPSDLMYVFDFQKVPDIKGRKYLREAIVMRYTDRLPGTGTG